MPRHLISDAHEWINEIPTVPIYYLAKPQPRERAWNNRRGKKTLLSLTLVRLCEMTWRCSISGSFGDLEIPLLLMSFYLFRETETCITAGFGSKVAFWAADLCGRHSQVGSLAGAAHLLNDNAGVLR